MDALQLFLDNCLRCEYFSSRGMNFTVFPGDSKSTRGARDKCILHSCEGLAEDSIHESDDAARAGHFVSPDV